MARNRRKLELTVKKIDQCIFLCVYFNKNMVPFRKKKTEEKNYQTS